MTYATSNLLSISVMACHLVLLKQDVPPANVSRWYKNSWLGSAPAVFTLGKRLGLNRNPAWLHTISLQISWCLNLHGPDCIMCLRYLLSWLGYHHSRHSHSKILIEWSFPTPGALEHLFYLSLGWNHVSTRFEATHRAYLLIPYVWWLYESTKYFQ